VNLIVTNKQPLPQWLNLNQAIAHCQAGASIWPWASTDNGVNPDIVLVGIGAVTTLEVMAAAQLLRTELPELRVRVVNVTDPHVLQGNLEQPRHLDEDMFEALFTADQPVLINFHGYPTALKHLLFGRKQCERFLINGYREESNALTAFDMHIRNATSRYHLLIQAIRSVARKNTNVAARAHERIHYYKQIIASHARFIQENGIDPEDIEEWHI
jgi:xylulose-5-phosphate/fructose-6-phosphate phosphoketolase